MCVFLNKGGWFIHLASLIRENREILSQVLQISSKINSYANECLFFSISTPVRCIKVKHSLHKEDNRISIVRK